MQIFLIVLLHRMWFRVHNIAFRMQIYFFADFCHSKWLAHAYSECSRLQNDPIDWTQSMSFERIKRFVWVIRSVYGIKTSQFNSVLFSISILIFFLVFNENENSHKPNLLLAEMTFFEVSTWWYAPSLVNVFGVKYEWRSAVGYKAAISISTP